MIDMKVCPCCGTTTSRGQKAHDKYYGLLERYADFARESGNQKAMINAAEEYLSNITRGVTRSGREGLIPYTKHLHDLERAKSLLSCALSAETAHENSHPTP